MRDYPVVVKKLGPIINKLDSLLLDFGASEPKYKVYIKRKGKSCEFWVLYSGDEATDNALDSLSAEGKLIPLIQRGQKKLRGNEEFSIKMNRKDFYPG